MKNKEIEELLNNLNKKLENYELDKKFGQLSVDSIYHLFPNEIQLLLSYIEQLEKRNKQLYEGFMATQEELTDYATKNEQLENNRDKAIEYIEIGLSQGGERELRDLVDGYEVLKLLKGDSDES